MKQRWSFLLLLLFMLSTAYAQSVVTIPVLQYPPLSVIAENVTVELPTEGLTIGSDVSVSGGDGSYTYEWTDGNGTVIGTASTLKINSAGEYFLKVTDGAGCSVSTKFNATATNGISAIETPFKITLQGNILHLQSSIPITEVRLLNLSGMLVKQYQPDNNSTSFSCTLPQQHGIYIIAVVVKGEKAIVKRITL